MPNADKRFSVLFDGFSDAFALNKKLFLICSDGYEKAFKSNEGFEQSAIDFANLVSSDKGCEIIEREIESWLREYSKYSGDDVSVGILFAKPESLDSQTPETASERPDLSYEPLVLGESLRKDYLSETDSQLAECDLNYPPEIQDE
jgi:hypothetical protein